MTRPVAVALWMSLLVWFCGCAEGQAGTRRVGDGGVLAPDAAARDGAAGSGGFVRFDAHWPLPDDDDGGGDVCGQLEVAVRRSVPRVQLVIDGSNSMTAPLSGATSRWNALGSALFDPGTGVVAQLDGVVAFGMSVYHAQSSAQCPVLDDHLPALENLAVLREAWDAYGGVPSGLITPTPEAVRAVRISLLDRIHEIDAPPGPLLLLLATDGEPYACGMPDHTPCAGKPEAELGACYTQQNELYRQQAHQTTCDETQTSFSAGIPTYVIGLASDPEFVSGLREIANVGRGLPQNTPAATGAQVYSPSDVDTLREALFAITGRGGGCVLSLMGTLQVANTCRGMVTLNDEPLGCDTADGFRARDERRIELLGDACKRFLVQPKSRVRARFPCDVIAPD